MRQVGSTLLYPEHPYRHTPAVEAPGRSRARGTTGECVPSPLRVMPHPPVARVLPPERRVSPPSFDALQRAQARAAVRTGLAAGFASFLVVAMVGSACMV